MADRADQLRRHRSEFEFAMREGISMAEARSRLAQQRWEAAEARRLSRCGTRDFGPEMTGENPDSATYWWNQGSMA